MTAMGSDRQTKVSALRAELELRGWRAIKSGTEWLKANQLAARFPATFGSVDAVQDLVAQRRIFTTFIDQKEFFAAYQFDQGGVPWPVMAPLCEMWKHRTEVALAGWMESTNGYLNGRRPRAMISVDPEAVFRAAEGHEGSGPWASEECPCYNPRVALLVSPRASFRENRS